MILSHCGLIYYLIISNLECVSYVDWASKFPFQWMHLYIFCLLYYWVVCCKCYHYILNTNHWLLKRTVNAFSQFFSFLIVCITVIFLCHIYQSFVICVFMILFFNKCIPHLRMWAYSFIFCLLNLLKVALCTYIFDLLGVDFVSMYACVCSLT